MLRNLVMAFAVALPAISFADYVGQPFHANIMVSPVGGNFVADVLLAGGPAVFGGQSAIGTSSEGIQMFLTTSQTDLGGGMLELEFSYRATDSSGNPSPFVTVMPVDVIQWDAMGLSRTDGLPYEIISDEADLFRADGTPFGATASGFLVGQTGTDFMFELPLVAGGANLTAFDIGGFDYRATVIVPGTGNLSVDRWTTGDGRNASFPSVMSRMRWLAHPLPQCESHGRRFMVRWRVALASGQCGPRRPPPSPWCRRD